MADSIAALKAKRKTAKNNRKIYNNRKSAVKKVIDNAYGMDDYYSKIKQKTDVCADHLNDGLLGFGAKVSAKCSCIRNSDEGQALSSQYPFTNAIAEMNSEYWRCDNEIKQLDLKIKTYERQIKEQGGILLPWE